MKIIVLFKKTFVVVIALMPIFLFSQNDSIIQENLPDDVEKLSVIFQNQGLMNVPVTIFNKTTAKVKVGDYGVAKINKKSPSESTTTIMGITYGETKLKFSIDFNDSLNGSSKLTGTKINNDLSESIKATLTTNAVNSKSWNFFFKISKINFLQTEVGRLTEGERTIRVVRRNFLRAEDTNENNEIQQEPLFYEFIENGVSLGAVTFDGENSIWLKPGLDSATKLILCAAMLSIAR